MTKRERHRRRREANRSSLGPVAAAPSFKAVKTKGVKRSKLRRGLIASTFVAVLVALMIGAPKMAHASLGVPEIDPGSMAGALTLLVGGVLALTDRVRHA